VTAGNVPATRWRLRVCYTKMGRPRFISHLDFIRLFERTARRVGLPLSYSEGFSPAPRIAYGWPLPVGLSGMAEYVDVELSSRVTPEEVVARLNRALPEGIQARDARYISPHGPSLMSEFDTGSYVAHLPASGRDLEEWRAAATRLLSRPKLEVTRERGGPVGRGGPAERGGPAGRGGGDRGVQVKIVDARPLIRRLEVKELSPDGRVVVLMELALGDKGAGRPDEVAGLLVAELAGDGVSVTRPEGMMVARLGLRRESAART